MEITADKSLIRKALPELREKHPIVEPAQTPQEAREHLEAYVIHPAFFDGPASSLAAEYLRDVLHIEPSNAVTLWALYTEAACIALNRPDIVPVPSFSDVRKALA